MDYETFDFAIRTRANYIVEQLSKTRPQEITIIVLLIITIGIGIAILLQIKKLKDRL